MPRGLVNLANPFSFVASGFYFQLFKRVGPCNLVLRWYCCYWLPHRHLHGVVHLHARVAAMTTGAVSPCSQDGWEAGIRRERAKLGSAGGQEREMEEVKLE